MPPVNLHRVGPQGAPLKSRTVLAARMREEGLIRSQVATALGCSERGVYNYMAGLYPVPLRRLHRLCDLVDLDPEELVDEAGYLLPDRQED